MQLVIIVLYLLLVFAVLCILIGLSIFTVSLIWSSIMGAPYVPSNGREIKEILKYAKLKKGQRFLELGCGDARAVRWAVKEYGVNGYGVDINPVLIFISRLRAKLERIRQIHLFAGNIYHTDLRKADIVYVFLMPEMLQKLRGKFAIELRENILIISHGFRIEYLNKMLEYKREHKPFPTYYYRFTRRKLTKTV